MVSKTTMLRSGLRPKRLGAVSSPHRPAYPARAAKLLIICGLTALSAGCVETTAQREPQPQLPPRTNMVRRDGVSPHGASVAVADIQGVSMPVSEHLSAIFMQAAREREINLTDAKSANYLVRGYLNATDAADGATFALVWDVYDSKKRRTQRIDDWVFVKGAKGNLETVDDATLTKIATKSADDLAAVLSNMPEAVAAAALPGSKAVAVALVPDGGSTAVPGTPPDIAASTPPRTAAPGIAAASR